MSLLMDALKKAEQAKRQNQEDGEERPASIPELGLGLELEPLPKSAAAPDLPSAEASSPLPPPSPTAPLSGMLPELPKHLEALDDEFLAHHASQAPRARMGAGVVPEPRPSPSAPPVSAETAPKRVSASKPGAATADKAAAQNAFAAKQPGKGGNKVFVIAVGVVTLIAMLGIGIYFWIQLQPKSAASNGLLALFKPTPPPPAAPRPAAAPIQAVAPSAAPAAVPAPPRPASPQIAAVPPAPTSTPTSAKSPARAPAPARDDEDEEDRPAPPPARAKATPQASAGDRPVRVTRMPPKIDPALSEAFAAWGKGDWAAAQSGYERALKSDPRNADALHGLAAVALRQKRFADAEQVYRRLLDVDPKDPVATAELINLRGQSDPLAAESRLKALIAGQPDLAQPHFALGNLYAAQGRWNEAQNAYFKAYTAEADNPDILFNLAVSLEHLRQNRLALQYYQQAVAIAQTRPAGFDKAQAGARIRALQP